VPIIDWFAPCASLRRVHAGEDTLPVMVEDVDHDEGPAVAVKVVARAGGGGGAEHRGSPGAREQRRPRQLGPLVRDGVPDDEAEGGMVRGVGAEEDATVARVVRTEAAVVGAGRAEGGRGDEAGGDGALEVAEEAEQGGRPAMEAKEPGAEGGGGDDAAPWLGGGGGAREARGVVGRDADEDLLDDLVRKRLRRRRTHARMGWGRRTRARVWSGAATGEEKGECSPLILCSSTPVSGL